MGCCQKCSEGKKHTQSQKFLFMDFNSSIQNPIPPYEKLQRLVITSLEFLYNSVCLCETNIQDK